MYLFNTWRIFIFFYFSVIPCRISLESWLYLLSYSHLQLNWVNMLSLTGLNKKCWIEWLVNRIVYDFKWDRNKKWKIMPVLGWPFSDPQLWTLIKTHRDIQSPISHWIMGGGGAINEIPAGDIQEWTNRFMYICCFLFRKSYAQMHCGWYSFPTWSSNKSEFTVRKVRITAINCDARRFQLRFPCNLSFLARAMNCKIC